MPHGCGSRRVSAWDAGRVVPVLPVVRMVVTGAARAVPVTTSVDVAATWLQGRAGE